MLEKELKSLTGLFLYYFYDFVQPFPTVLFIYLSKYFHQVTTCLTLIKTTDINLQLKWNFDAIWLYALLSSYVQYRHLTASLLSKHVYSMEIPMYIIYKID